MKSGRAPRGIPYLKLTVYLTKGTNQITGPVGCLNRSGPGELDTYNDMKQEA